MRWSKAQTLLELGTWHWNAFLNFLNIFKYHPFEPVWSRMDDEPHGWWGLTVTRAAPFGWHYLLVPVGHAWRIGFICQFVLLWSSLEIGGNMAMIKYCNRPGCLGAFAKAASVSQERGADSNGWSWNVSCTIGIRLLLASVVAATCISLQRITMLQ